jgi:hypothetical protein
MSRLDTALRIGAAAGVIAGLAGCGASPAPPHPPPPSYVKQLDAVCPTRHTRTAFGYSIRTLDRPPKSPAARVAALRTAGATLRQGLGGLAAKLRGLEAAGSDQPVLDGWLKELRRLADLTAQAAATERSTIRSAARHPGVYGNVRDVGNADLNRAREARRVAARTARSAGLEKCARLLGR